MTFDWITAEMLYWLGSTVAQAEVGLLAFGALIALWRSDREEAADAALRNADDLANTAARVLSLFGGLRPRRSVKTTSPVGIALDSLVRAGVGSFVASVAVIVLAEPSTRDGAHPLVGFLGFAALSLCVGASLLSVFAAWQLTRVTVFDSET